MCHKGPINALLQSRSAQFLRFRRQTRNWTCGKQSLRLLQQYVWCTCTTVAAAPCTVHLHHCCCSTIYGTLASLYALSAVHLHHYTHYLRYTCTTMRTIYGTLASPYALSTVHLHHYTHQFGSVCIIRHSNNSFMVSLINLSATPNNNNNNKSAATISSFDDTHCFVSLNCSSNCLEWSVCTHCPKALRRPTLMSAPT